MTDTRPSAAPQAGLAPAPPPTPAPGAGATSGGDSLAGFFYALGAYSLWGFLPLYMKALAHVSPVEVIVHRVIWSVPVAIAIGMKPIAGTKPVMMTARIFSAMPSRIASTKGSPCS